MRVLSRLVLATLAVNLVSAFIDEEHEAVVIEGLAIKYFFQPPLPSSKSSVMKISFTFEVRKKDFYTGDQLIF